MTMLTKRETRARKQIRAVKYGVSTNRKLRKEVDMVRKSRG